MDYSRRLFHFGLVVLGLAISGCMDNTNKETAKAPVARIENKELVAHGETRIDPYYWLNERENPAVIAYLEAENTYTQAMMKHTVTLQQSLYDEMVGRIPQEEVSAPYLENGHYYYTRYEKGKEYPLFCRKKGSLAAVEEVMLNANVLAEGHSFFQVGNIEVSPDNRVLAYAVDTVSRRIYTIYFRNLETGELMKEKISNTSANFTWANDSQTLFYTTKDESLRMDRIWKHRLGTTEEDELVYHETDATFSTHISRTKSDKYLVISSESTLTDESRILEADNPEGEFRIFQERRRDVKYEIAHSDDRFYIRTNDGARNFRLLETPENMTASDNWKDVITHRPDVLIEDFDVFKGYMAVLERQGGMNQIRILNRSGLDFYLEFKEQAYTVSLGDNREYVSDRVRYEYTSLTTPNSVIDFNINTRQHELIKRQEVVGGYDPELYFTERIMVTADDGVLVPLTMVYRLGTEKTGTNPCLLYGYGSYGASMDPWFSPVRLSLLDRGFIYAIAHVRGGQEMGRSWYEDGKLLHKKNTFTDFIACATALVDRGYTSPEHLYAMGGSAGGLLMGAVINMRPDLFNGVVAAVPFVDVVTTMLDESIPLTTSEYDEWGNPNDPEYYHYMLSYSPYDNVTSQAYPALLVTTGLHDSQVQYWEPAKWVAKLRSTRKGDTPLYLWTNMDYGHGGASGRFERYREIALEYAFILDLENISE